MRAERPIPWRPLGRRPALTGTVVVVAGALTGLAVVLYPPAAWALVIAVGALLLLLAPPQLSVGAAVLAVASSRLLVATGFFSELLNFFHFPLVLTAALAAAAEPARRFPLRRPLGLGLVGLLAACLLSWIVNGGQPIRPLLDWLVYAEPFLLIYALAALPPGGRGVRALWGLALAVPFAQLPLAAYQALTLGLSDSLQGLFPGLGAGAHVAGAVALLGSLICVARAVTGAGPRAGLLWLSGAALQFLVAVLADAKQVIIVFFPALVLLLLGLLRLRWSRALAALPVLAGVILGAFSYYRPLQVALDWALISRGGYGKLEAFAVIASKFSSQPGGWLFGLGPGNSVSRVALMALEGYAKPASPVQLLGLAPASTTLELWNLTVSNRLFASSSVWSPISSWLGLLGDLGLAGFGVYLWMYWSLWRGLGSAAGWQVRLARAVLFMCGLLGLLFNWLEEPGFMVPAALLIGLGFVAGKSSAAEAPV